MPGVVPPPPDTGPDPPARRRPSRARRGGPRAVPGAGATHSPRGRHGSYEVSAGGLVVRTSGSEPAAALIGRLDRRGRLRWSMPKGHVEAGETTEQAAIREVREETGIQGAITAKLGSVDYSFTAGSTRIRKRVHHFLMRAVAGELSDDDIEVTEVAWVPLAEAVDLLAYAGERRLARLAADMLGRSA